MLLLRRQRDRVGDHQLLYVTAADLLDGAVGEDGVDAGGGDALGAAPHREPRGGEDGAAGEDLVVRDDDVLPRDFSDKRVGGHLFAVTDALLVDDGERRIELSCDVARPLGVADVGSQDGGVREIALFEVSAENVQRGQLIDRDVEEALDLAGVQVDGQDAVGASGLDKIGEQARGDRHARLVLLIAAAVAVVRKDRGDTPCRCALERIDHDQQFHDAAADRRRERLDDEDVLRADVLENADEDVLVRELEDLALTERHFERAANSAGESGVGVAREDAQVLVHVASATVWIATRRRERAPQYTKLWSLNLTARVTCRAIVRVCVTGP